MIRIVEEDGCCPICKCEIWRNSNGLWVCSCNEVWDEGRYMRNLSQEPKIAALLVLEEVVSGLKKYD